MNSGSMSVYRDRLMRKGIVDTSKYGYLSLLLPRFAEIVEREDDPEWRRAGEKGC